MLHAKLKNRTCQGLDRQGQGQEQGPSLQGQGQRQGQRLTSLVFVPCATAVIFKIPTETPSAGF